MTRLIRLPEVKAQTGLCRSAIYAAMQAGTFPKSIKLSPRAVAWVDSEIQDWVAKKIETARDTGIR